MPVCGESLEQIAVIDLRPGDMVFLKNEDGVTAFVVGWKTRETTIVHCFHYNHTETQLSILNTETIWIGGEAKLYMGHNDYGVSNIKQMKLVSLGPIMIGRDDICLDGGVIIGDTFSEVTAIDLNSLSLKDRLFLEIGTSCCRRVIQFRIGLVNTDIQEIFLKYGYGSPKLIEHRVIIPRIISVNQLFDYTRVDVDKKMEITPSKILLQRAPENVLKYTHSPALC